MQIGKQAWPFSDTKDKVTKDIIVIPHPHQEIHEGYHFFYSDNITLANGAIQNYLLTTPNSKKTIHLSSNLEGSAITQFEIYEASDKVGTTLQTIYNNNRDSVITAELKIHKDITGGTTDGTRIINIKGGSSTNQSRASFSASQDNEIMLKKNTKYIIRVTSGTDGNLINTMLSWYEHV